MRSEMDEGEMIIQGNGNQVQVKSERMLRIPREIKNKRFSGGKIFKKCKNGVIKALPPVFINEKVEERVVTESRPSILNSPFRNKNLSVDASPNVMG